VGISVLLMSVFGNPHQTDLPTFVPPQINSRTRFVVEPEFRAFDTAFGDLKEIRNQFQHINNDIENEFAGPLLGAVCWVEGRKQYIATFHDIGRARSSPSIVYDSSSAEYIHEFCFIYNEQYYDLKSAIKGMDEIMAFINSKVEVAIDGSVYKPEEHFAAICVEIRPCDNTKGM
jgi:hypothetical protein